LGKKSFIYQGLASAATHSRFYAIFPYFIVVFLSGSFWYKKVPPKDNVFGEVYRALKASPIAKNKFKQFNHGTFRNP
jgi:hypothetical protein